MQNGNVLVVGAGRVGRTITTMLEAGGYQVRVADARPEAAKLAAGNAFPESVSETDARDTTRVRASESVRPLDQGTATIDGMLSAGEWDNAASFAVSFLALRDDTEAGGSLDGGARQVGPEATVFEIGRPLNSGDPADVTLMPEDVIGISMTFRRCEACSETLWSGADEYARRTSRRRESASGPR